MQLRLLIVSFEQFGYHVDTVKYAEHLDSDWSVTHLCLDWGLERLSPGREDVVYVEKGGGSAEFVLLRSAVALIRQTRPDVVWWRNTKLAFVARLTVPGVPMVLDIRSGSVHPLWWQRRRENLWIRWNSLFFRHVAVVSEGLGRQLRIAPHRLWVVGLASDLRPLRRYRGDGELRLLYIGTLHHRHMEQTVEGLARFLARRPISCRYTMVVFGSEQERGSLDRVCADYGLGEVIKVLPRVPYAELDSVLVEHDVGIAYAPKLDCYEHQPFTKLHEYLHAGLACLTVATTETRKLITPANGVLVDATAGSFADGLETLVARLPTLEPAAIQRDARHRTWATVVDQELRPLLECALGEPT